MTSTLRRGKLQEENGVYKRYACDLKHHVILQYRPDWPEDSGHKPGKDGARASCNAAMASTLYAYLASYHVPVGFVRRLGEDDLLMRETEALPVTWKVWNFALDDLAERLGLAPGEILDCPIVETRLCHGDLPPSLVGADHLCALGLGTAEEMQRADRLARKVNAVLKSFLERRGLKLVDAILTFGRLGDGELCLSDGLDADSLRFVDLQDFGTRQFKIWDPKTARGGYADLMARLENERV